LRRADLRAVCFAFLPSFVAAARRFVPLPLIFFFAAFARGAARFGFGFGFGFTFVADFALRPIFAGRLRARFGGALGAVCRAAGSGRSAGATPRSPAKYATVGSK
jgi:hypothetical protein